MPANVDQVSVPMPPEMRAYLERKAEESDRSVAYIVRQAVAEAERRERQQRLRKPASEIMVRG